MPAPISVVIPTLDAEADLPGTAAALMGALQAGLIRELVVSDGGSRDGTAAIARELGARLIEGPPGRGGQLQRGVKAARGDWLLLLHADSELATGWIDAAEAHMARDPDKAGYFRLRFRASGLAPGWIAGWARMRSGLFGLPFGDQGLFLRRDVLERAGGVPDIPLMEDVALARALRGRLVALPADIVTSASRYERQGWLRQGMRNLGLQARYFAGTPAEVLAARYRR